MLRIGAIFVVVCMVLIAGSIGAVAYLALALDASTAGVVAMAVLVGLVLYNTIDNRLRDRRELGDQIADLSRGTADLGRQVAELTRRFSAVEGRIDTSLNRARSATDPLASEIGELGLLVQQLADSVAHHETLLHQAAIGSASTAPLNGGGELAAAAAADPLPLRERDTVSGVPRCQGLSREEIIELGAQAVVDNRSCRSPTAPASCPGSTTCSCSAACR
ncbi:MAG: hypothetical protein P8Z80_16420 [Pseudolabrys sp.]